MTKKEFPPPCQNGIRGNFNLSRAFTLLELMVVIAIIGILAALLLPVLSRTKARAQRPVCMNNLHQISVGVRMYADDSSDAFPPATNHPPAAFTSYTLLMKSYVGLTGASPEKTRLFACPSDTFYYQYKDYVSTGMHLQSNFYYSSYSFNGGNFLTGSPPAPRWPGIAGRKLSSIKEPSKTVLDSEFSAAWPFSWHLPGGTSHYNNSMNMVSFADGHVSFIKMYWDAAVTNNHIEAWQYDPPAGYDYKWSGD